MKQELMYVCEFIVLLRRKAIMLTLYSLYILAPFSLDTEKKCINFSMYKICWLNLSEILWPCSTHSTNFKFLLRKQQR